MFFSSSGFDPLVVKTKSSGRSNFDFALISFEGVDHYLGKWQDSPSRLRFHRWRAASSCQTTRLLCSREVYAATRAHNSSIFWTTSGITVHVSGNRFLAVIETVRVQLGLKYGLLAGPICPEHTGLAMPKKAVMFTIIAIALVCATMTAC
jgi:hypothetical protein